MWFILSPFERAVKFEVRSFMEDLVVMSKAIGKVDSLSYDNLKRAKFRAATARDAGAAAIQGPRGDAKSSS